MQDLVRRCPGVTSARVGYSGGGVPNAAYRNHGSHAEAIEIIFDPQRLSFRKLAEYFSRLMIRPHSIGKGMTVKRGKANARHLTRLIAGASS